MLIMTNSIWINIQQWKTACFLWNNVILTSKWKNVVFFVSIPFWLDFTGKQQLSCRCGFTNQPSSSKLPSSRTIASSIRGWISKGRAWNGGGREATQLAQGCSWAYSALSYRWHLCIKKLVLMRTQNKEAKVKAFIFEMYKCTCNTFRSLSICMGTFVL